MDVPYATIRASDKADHASRIAPKSIARKGRCGRPTSGRSSSAWRRAAGGVILRDLFNSDDGGWLQDPSLLDRLVMEKLEREAEAVRAEGWKWIEVAPDFPYGHTYDLRRLAGEQRALTEEEATAHAALKAEFDRLEETYAEANAIPEEVDQRLSEIETALAGFEERPVIYDPAEIARAGAFISIDGSGSLRIERGYVRPEDEPPVKPSEAGA